MIDFETFGTSANACICQVGAVFFDKTTGELGAELSINIDAASSVEAGGIIDASTVYFWLQQSKEAQETLFANKTPILEAFNKLNDFLAPATRIWSHVTFDFVLLSNTMRMLKIKPSFSYKAGLDLRTLTFLSGLQVDKTPRKGVHHNGLDDAKHQVTYAVAALNHVKTSKTAIQFLERLNG